MSSQPVSALPLYLAVRGCADALSVSPRTILRWVDSGELRGVQYSAKLHWTDKPRKTQRRRWLIELASVEELLARMYAGEPAPPGILRRLREMAQPNPESLPRW